MRFNALDAVFPFIKENARNNFVVRAGVHGKPGDEPGFLRLRGLSVGLLGGVGNRSVRNVLLFR